MSDSAFERDTRLEPLEALRWRANLSHDWSIASEIPNGGYLLAVAARALAEALPHPDPLSVTAYYLARADEGPCELTVEVLQQGRGSSVGEARLWQQDSVRAVILGRFGELDALRGPTLVDTSPPPLAPLEDCLEMKPVPGLTPPLTQVIDQRFDPSIARWMDGEPGGEAATGGYIRFRDGRPPDALSLTFFADAFPPAVFNHFGFSRWVPTLHLDVQLRARPAPGWLRCWFTTRCLVDGTLEEDGEIWDSQGQLVAICRQLALLRG